jgi:hypothetical protein
LWYYFIMVGPGIESSNTLPLLSVSDIEPPLEMGERVDAASILTRADCEPDDTDLEAIGFYRRKELQRLMGSAAFDASGLAERVEALDERLPSEIQESDLLARLVQDLDSARLEAARPTNKRKFPDIFGFRQRREKRERMYALREKASVREMIEVTDLQEGDEVIFKSGLLKEGKSRLEGKVIGAEESRFGPIVLIKVRDERHKGPSDFSYPERSRGATVHLIGTVLRSNQYRKHPSKIVLGEALQFLDAGGERFISGIYRSDTDRYLSGPSGLELQQLSVNGTDLFPRSKK